jgi:hypothetical protein
MKQAPNRPADLIPDLRSLGDNGLITDLPVAEIGADGPPRNDIGGGRFWSVKAHEADI